MKFDFYTTLLLLTFIWYLILKFYVVLFPSPVGKVRNNNIKIKTKKLLGLKKNSDCVTKALFSNISNITFVQIFVIYLCTNTHCYY